ncbi:hypothetical protein AKJ66_01545 [candidate division MSBL1 archaeon SCGC-AAA259E22]|uniref:Uncharacterized protein n=1 Tax=candidate division MSBL1 archaeon SCGC-AAA259E22 TaxID=1698265 RepID=A0A133UHJ8_9EURY|nr:hypothetical protein AKJ66_01545 [candidate division MSBL1 archaeon SCGC-AAA259E22]
MSKDEDKNDEKEFYKKMMRAKLEGMWDAQREMYGKEKKQSDKPEDTIFTLSFSDIKLENWDKPYSPHFVFTTSEKWMILTDKGWKSVSSDFVRDFFNKCSKQKLKKIMGVKTEK